MLKAYVKKEELLEKEKYNDEMLYDPIWGDDLNKIKKQFKDYFKDE